MNSEGIEDYGRRKMIKTLKKKQKKNNKERKKKHKRMCTVCIQLELAVSLLAQATWQWWNCSGLRQGPAVGWWVPKEACVCTSPGHGKFNKNARKKLLCEMSSVWVHAFYYLLFHFLLLPFTKLSKCSHHVIGSFELISWIGLLRGRNEYQKITWFQDIHI